MTTEAGVIYNGPDIQKYLFLCVWYWRLNPRVYTENVSLIHPYGPSAEKTGATGVWPGIAPCPHDLSMWLPRFLMS
jgi:hypothetical protein